MAPESAGDKWSNEQPPAWQGPAIEADAYPAERELPAAPPAPSEVEQPGQPERSTSGRSLISDTFSLFARNRRALLRTALKSLPWALLILVPATLAMDAAGTALGLDLQSDVTALSPAESAALTAWSFVAAGLNLVAQTWLTARVAWIAFNDQAAATSGSANRSWLRFLLAQLFVLLAIAVAAAPGLIAMSNISETPLGLTAALATIALVPAWAGWTLWLAAGTLPLVGVTTAEDRGALSAIKRSLQLAKGARWRLIGPYLVMSLIGGLLASTLTSALLLINFEIWWQNSLLGAIGTALALCISVPLQAVVMALSYISRRLEIEPPTDGVS